jgi:hypothetical protein
VIEKLKGIVELDECFIGGKEANKHEHKKLRAGRGPVGELDAVVDAVLAYKPKPKTKAAKRRVRRQKRATKKSG